MESETDSEGEDLEMIRPSLIRELRNVLDEYPDDGQILKELIQNAEDAGATTVKILTDSRHYNQLSGRKALKKHPHLKFFQGPALCAYNDAEFTTRDWQGIRMLHTSVKEKDPLKVGRFGLGFKSVFHMTDRLVILSGDSIMYMDPFKGEGRYCKRTRVAGKKGRELESLLKSLEGVFGVSQETFRTESGGFHGTLFWFPLRQTGSELSSTVYSEGKVQNLLAAFKAEAPSLLLFLNNIQRVSIYSRDDTCGPGELFSVGLASSCLEKVCEERKRFVDSIRSAGQEMPVEASSCVTELFMETIDHFPQPSSLVDEENSEFVQTLASESDCFVPKLGQAVSWSNPSRDNETVAEDITKTDELQKFCNIQRWLVVSYHPGQGDVSEELSQLCADPELSYRPYVGVAVPLTSPNKFQSQVFCFLPLPLDTRSPTGLPVHVHGFFALSQNRRHLKWPTADQLSQQAHLDPPLRWNCLLVEELLPRVYRTLLNSLKNTNAPNPLQFYAAWPDVNSVDDRWRPLLQPLYTAFVDQFSFYSHNLGSQWVHLNQAVLEQFSQEMPDEVKAAVTKVYSINKQNLVQLPDHVHNTLQELGLLQNVNIISAEYVSHLLPTRLQDLSCDDGLHLLHFLSCHHEAHRLVQNQELLPLADGTFSTFKDRECEFVPVYWCRDDTMQLFPGLESEFCDTNVSPVIADFLCRLAQSGKFTLTKLTEDDTNIPELIQRSLHARFGDKQPSLSPGNIWIQGIWDFLAPRDLTGFHHLTLLPTQEESNVVLLPLSGIYVCRCVRGMTPLTTDLISCLTKLGVRVLAQLPDYVTRRSDILGHRVHFPSTEGLLSAMKCVNDDVKLRQRVTEQFNACSSPEEKEALLAFLIESTGEIPLEMFQQLKLFTEVTTGRSVSVDEVNVIAPDCLPPVTPPQLLLSCSTLQRHAATRLGAKEVTLVEIIKEEAQMIKTDRSQFSSTEITSFFEFVLLNKEMTADTTVLDLMKDIEFVPTSSGQLKLPKDLYDPTSVLLQKMFLTEELFPFGGFTKPKILSTLRLLGLRTEKEVKSSDVIATAELIQELLVQEKEETAVEKAEGLLEILIRHGQNLDHKTLRHISAFQCLPCLKDEDKPDNYPKSLPFSCRSKLSRPKEMCYFSQAKIIGSVLPIIKESIPSEVAKELQVGSLVAVEQVLQNLDNILTHYQSQEASLYRLILSSIFHVLGQHIDNPTVPLTLTKMECVLTESGDRFAKPGAFWINAAEDDIQLKPYKFLLPNDMQNGKDLFLACGAVLEQDATLLRDVLQQIKSCHSHQALSQSEFNRDFQLVKQVLDILGKSGSETDGTVLLPVCHCVASVLCFQPAKECTVISSDALFNAESFAEDEEIFIVHHEIHQDIAVALGALTMKERALTGVEDLDFGYEQREELTTRLHSLLKDSYTDGLSVPKELIQNADDAGATEVHFLMDERENEGARKNLITNNMDTLQGPAFWVYNDATFSDTDFENIIKFGAGTKKDDASKVGQFGLGFNSVYNLTDVPSFISRHTMAMFDPHVKYLKGGAGLRLDFRHPMNRALLSRMPQQFKPFQGVFGCILQNKGEVHYDGTLFRFPLRTAQQAADSLIKNECYGMSKRQEFLRMLLEKAGNLLMFTQNVQKVKVFYLPRDCTDPSSPQCLMDLSKTSQNRVLEAEVELGNQSILQYFTTNWFNDPDIAVLEDVKIEMTVTRTAHSVCEIEEHSSTTHWRLAWASGTDQSAQMARKNVQKGMIPLAAVATLLKEGGLGSITESPPGFYKSGHLYCFLPLPETIVFDNLLVHVNATFALTSSRRCLLVQTEDDLNSEGAAWNTALIADAVSRAYLLLLENVHKEATADIDFKRFFQLWPVLGEAGLVENFYKHLMAGGNKLLPLHGGNQWVNFQDAWFLHSEFRSSQCGEIALKTLEQFWSRDGYLVDVPLDVSHLLQRSGQSKIISQLDFYKEVFFPNLASIYFKKEDRDRLVLHALHQHNSEIDALIRKSSCIPCTSPRQFQKEQMLSKNIDTCHTGHQEEEVCYQLKRPEDLYDSCSTMLQQLFLKENMFPCVEFRQPDVLEILKSLGLKSEDSVTCDDIIETAKLIQMLEDQQEEYTAQQKAEGLWKLLTNYGHTIDTETLRQISAIQCLLCLQCTDRPEHYPQSLPFGVSTTLASSQDICHLSQAQVVGSVMPVIREGLAQHVANTLQVGCHVDSKHVFKHLDNIINHYDVQEASRYRLVLSEIFHFLEEHMSDPVVIQTLQEKECVLTESGLLFAKPSDFWIERTPEDIDLKPYKYPLPNEMTNKRNLFQECGTVSQQDPELLHNVLLEIQNFHSQQTRSQSEFDRDFQLVKQILDALNRKKSDVGSVLLPLCHSEPNVLQFKQAGECTVMSGENLFSAFSLDDGEEIFIVHPDIHQHIAVGLGALKLKDRVLTGVEDLDFGYEQREELTSRIQNLLKDSYTDGFSVPKELIQNADDAGASEVCFLLDERENQDARKNLITDNMDSLQGPAFWAYNNATFSDADFENIIKLGAGTKRDDASKVGRFGLGFNSVYNLTDVPSFISRHTMAMFDPHVKYLKGGAGLKLDFRRPVNRALLSRMPQQFKPFQGVFGCSLQSEGDVCYDGTLFRFPLRTAEQASDSQIKNECYSTSKCQEFLRMLLERAGNLLMFTQNVRNVKVFYLPHDCTDPTVPCCLMDLTKKPHNRILFPEAELENQSILQYFTTHWFSSPDIKIVEDVTIDMIVTHEAKSVCKTESHKSTTQWRVAWASGTGQSAEMARQNKQGSVVPLAAAAALFGEDGLKAIEDSPSGFYRTGHLFVFLPLPDPVVFGNLLVHLNATFALTSSRRNLLVTTEDDMSSEGAAWNLALIADAVSRAYLLLLENVRTEAAADTNFTRFFKLWPVSGEPDLVENFYRHLVTDKNELLPVPGENQWVTFNDARFLESCFRDSEYGEIAWKALKHFWNGEGHLVDVPSGVLSLVLQFGQAKMISQIEFFKDTFFPNIASTYFEKENRDKLILYSLHQQNSAIDELIKGNPCIPCASPEQLDFQESQIYHGCEEAGLGEQLRYFNPPSSDHLKLAKDLYQPDSQILQKLFLTENMFPCGDFTKSDTLKILKKLGLKSEDTVTPDDIVATSKFIQELWTQQDKHTAQQKADGLWKLLKKYGHTIDTETLRQISGIQCLPCLQHTDRPEHYPRSLPFGMSTTLASSQDMCHLSQAQVVGSVMPVIREGLSQHVANTLQVGCQVDMKHVFKHLDNIINHYDVQEASRYRLVLSEIFHFLEEHMSDPVVIQTLQEKECVLTESGLLFAKPSDFWIERTPEDIDLKPYKYPLPNEMTNKRNLFQECGAVFQQDAELLRNVLLEIQNFHSQQTRSQSEFDRDFQLVKQILDALNRKKSDGGSVLLPLCHSEPNVLQFKQAGECTVVSGESLLSNLSLDDEEELFIVHPEIHQDTATGLGALKMKDRALTGVESLDFGYGQSEELTTRLHNLLKDSYTDGFSVPKELIQNADDAGATEVCFLLDERENEDARQNLITDNLDSLQGPAFWAYNNATFSDADFENIIKLGAGTKKEDASRLGRFGLGFNSVYNLTDVPSFISRHTLAIFDPHEKYLKQGAGLKLDFRRSVNRALLTRMPQQFKPFQGVFGCHLGNERNVHFEGTLFRLPLRTSAQAADSKIKNECYDRNKCQEFLAMLLERAGNLLMFAQNVQKLKLFYLPADSTEPSTMLCLLDISKDSQKHMIGWETELGNKTILQFCSSEWSENTDIKILEDVKIEMKVTQNASSLCEVEAHTSTTQWRTAWASGTAQSAQMAHQDKRSGLVPLAAVAVLLDGQYIKALENSPPGFYKTGHLFCFLPLPDSVVHGSLVVHVNACFALTSSRRSLLECTEDDLDSKGAAWNSALMSDAVCQAYLLLLDSLHEEAAMDSDCDRFYELWPVSGGPDLMENFYRLLVTNGNKILPVCGGCGQWVSFNDAWFLEHSFRRSACGDVAWKALQHFWGRKGHLVDIPLKFHSLIKSSGQAEAFQARVISEQEFYTEVFFPNIGHGYWAKSDRDKLIHHAILQKQQEMDSLLKHYPCIPCEDTLTLQLPGDVIHPRGTAAKLYSSSDGRFPQKTKEDKEHNINFCAEQVLERLVELGMITDDLPWEMVVERASSVEGLETDNENRKHLRARAILYYLASVSKGDFRISSCPTDVRNMLSQTKFLPVLSKPTDWPFPWAGETDENTQVAAPCDLYFDNLKDLVACHKKVIDCCALRLTVSTYLVGVLEVLGVQTKVDPKNQELLQISTVQLQTIAQTEEGDKERSLSLIQNVCKTIYTYLTKCLEETDQASAYITQELSGKDVVWTGANFVDPSKVSFKLGFDCRPYLFSIEASFRDYKTLFGTIGVKEMFDIAKLTSVLQEICLECDGSQLPDEKVGLVSRIAQSLCECVSASTGGKLDSVDIFLPDRAGFMLPTCNLCVDDCLWLEKTKSMKFVSDKIPLETARTLGVKTKRRQDIESMIKLIPFGQKEKLTDRITRLLEGYTFDSSVFKELLQNADDAGATEVKFIKDFRHLGKEKVLEGCESLQGPALCVFNNKSFTKQDLEGIQNLGRGSKGQDALLTGQYGVGFNAVYHFTDVPSFWTLEEDENAAICILDPNCQHIAKTTPDNPGVKLEDIRRFQECYPDMFAGYLSTAIDMTKPGTIFRFPLRTEEMAANSKIKNEAVTDDQVIQFLDQFRKEMNTYLLFLNNIRKIGIYSVNEDGSLKLENEVVMEIDRKNTDDIDRFKKSLFQMSEAVKNDTISPGDVDTFEACASVTIKPSRNAEENWLIVHRVGLQDISSVSNELQNEWKKENFRLLPRGGVAVKLTESPRRKRSSPARPSQCNAFCILPLPVHTNLPMHVNGHFALNQETRRDLWHNKVDNKSDIRTEWNEMIAWQNIVPAYITALQWIRDVWFSPSENLDHIKLSARLNYYHSLFPDLDLDSAPTQFWTIMRKKLYKQIAEQELPLFPTLSTAQVCSVEWVPAVKSLGFAGYFNNLETFFCNAPDKPKCEKPVVLSQGGVHQNSADSKDSTTWAKQKAEELKVLVKEMNMKVLETPYSIFENFKKSGENGVMDISPENVVHFLKSAGTETQGCCNISNLPQPVSSTSLRTPANVKTLITFIKHCPLFDNLQGLPLNLRQSENLYFFQETEDRPVVSKCYDLLPGSKDCFIHKELIDIFVPISGTLEKWMRNLDISTLIRLLPCTLSVDHFRTGQPCSFDISKFPSQSWLKHFWVFLSGVISAQQTTDPVDCFRKTEQTLQSLSEWSLLPVKQRTVQGENPQLYPIKDVHKIVYLPKTPDTSNQWLWQALKTMYLPFLNADALRVNNVVLSIVASISRPFTLLKALKSCASNLAVRVDQAAPILEYFNSNLTGLKESVENTVELQQLLKCLPLYHGIDGKLTEIPAELRTLCLESNVTNEGLIEWALNRKHPIVLLKKEFVSNDLCIFLGFDFPTVPEFYCQYLLPTLSDLPQNAILSHMHTIRRGLPLWKKDKKLVVMQVLAGTEFLAVDNEFQKASSFYSPHVPVFKAMNATLPPRPYCENQWESFMKSAGMISEVTQDLFIQFAHTLQAASREGLNAEIAQKSETLVRHLFTRKDLNADFLQQIKDIRFVCPSEWTDTAEGQILCQIAKPFRPNRLISFSESYTEQHLFLVWTNSCVLHQNADPANFQLISKETLRQLLHHLGFERNVPKTIVIEHVKTVCQCLVHNIGKKIHRLEVVKEVMKVLYQYLQNYVSDSELLTLSQLAIICDVENKQMLKPQNVVMDLREEEAIARHIVKAPLAFGDYFRLFRRLGAAKRVTANHYAIVLSQLKQKAAENFLHVEEMKLYVQTAVRELFKCLKSEKEEVKRLTVDHLYLPSETECLVKSTHLVFIDDQSLASRFQELPQDIHFFLGFKKLNIKNMIAQTELKLLPNEHQLQMLSSIVIEVVPEDMKRRALKGQHSRDVERLLKCPKLAEVVVRLAFDHHTKYNHGTSPFTEATANQIIHSLSHISVKETEDLKTMLMWKRTEEHIHGTERDKKAFVDECSANGNRPCTVYLDRGTCDREGTKIHTIAKSLKYAVLHSISVRINSDYLLAALRNPEEALKQMNEDGIQPCDFRAEVEQTVFPPPGTFIPVHLHCYLDNNFDSFYDGEYVGFEVYDPQVDEHDTDENEPVYIYAIVIEEIKQEGEIPQIAKRYRVDLGIEKGESEVSVTQLYKFIRKPNQGTSKPVVKYERRGTSDENLSAGSREVPDRTASANSERVHTLDFKAVMKEIRKVLTEAWKSLDERGRNRVLKRLLLKWHPDKNRDNEQFCTRVVQCIQQYVDLLKRGKTLPDDEDTEDNVNEQFGRRQSSSSDFSSYSSFFENMNRRGRTYHDQFQSHSRRRSHRRGHSSSSGSEGSRYHQRFREDDYGSFHYRTFSDASSANPQPTEGRRWLRQAEADLADAHAARQKLGRGYNWICFLCHQATEKALKAVIYHRNANSSSIMDYNLVHIANTVGDEMLRDLAKRLEERVGNHMRMRYPDVFMCPRIPSDVYNIGDATQACDLAARAVRRVKDILRCPRNRSLPAKHMRRLSNESDTF